jgi:hypothetical protein
MGFCPDCSSTGGTAASEQPKICQYPLLHLSFTGLDVDIVSFSGLDLGATSRVAPLCIFSLSLGTCLLHNTRLRDRLLSARAGAPFLSDPPQSIMCLVDDICGRMAPRIL